MALKTAPKYFPLPLRVHVRTQHYRLILKNVWIVIIPRPIPLICGVLRHYSVSAWLTAATAASVHKKTCKNITTNHDTKTGRRILRQVAS